MKTDNILVVGFAGLLLHCQTTLAQIPIEKEPHHKVILENQLVRVIELNVPSGDTTLFHTHNAASAVIFLSASTFAIQNSTQAPVITAVKLGDVVFREYDKKPVAHTVWSADTTKFRCVVVELKQK